MIPTAFRHNKSGTPRNPAPKAQAAGEWARIVFCSDGNGAGKASGFRYRSVALHFGHERSDREFLVLV